MSRILEKLRMMAIFAIGSVGLYSGQIIFAMEGVPEQKLTLKELHQEQEAVANLKVVKTEPKDDERFPISYNYVIDVAKKTIEAMKADENYIPPKEKRKLIYLCDDIFKKIKKDLEKDESAWLEIVTHPGQEKTIKNLRENSNLTYDTVKKSLGISSTKNIKEEDVTWAVNHLEKLSFEEVPPAPVMQAVSISDNDVLLALQKIFEQTPIINSSLTKSGGFVIFTQEAEDRIPFMNILKDTFGFKIIEENKNPAKLAPDEVMFGRAQNEVYIRRGAVPKLLMTVLGFEKGSVVGYMKNSSPSPEAFNVPSFDPSLSFPKVPQLSLEESKANWRQWVLDVATWVNDFFKKPYAHSSQDNSTRLVDGNMIKVSRPNHALAHGMRSGFLAVDIVDELAAADPSNFKSTQAGPEIELLRQFLMDDPYFRQKVLMVAAYQRTGRESEIDGTEDTASTGTKYKDRYISYLQADYKNFYNRAKQLLKEGQIFTSEEEIMAYAQTLYDDGTPISSPYYRNIKNVVQGIVKAAHMLDLKRLSNVNPKGNFIPAGVKASVLINLFGYIVDKPIANNWKTWKVQNGYDYEEKFVENLWNREEAYLVATGDRPLNDAHYLDKFYLQAQNPELMVEALLDAKEKLDRVSG